MKSRLSRVFLGILSLTMLMGLASCSDDDEIRGSGNLESEFREVGYFDKVNSVGVYEINMIQGETQSVKITADDNILNDVITSVSNNQLLLDLKNDNYTNITLKAEITLTDFYGVTNSGVGNITIGDIDVDHEVEVVNSGTGDINIKGEAESMTIYNEGTGDIESYDLLIEDAVVEIVGSGDVQINASTSLKIKISGSGDVYYKGSPTIDVTIEGSGKVINVD